MKETDGHHQASPRATWSYYDESLGVGCREMICRWRRSSPSEVVEGWKRGMMVVEDREECELEVNLRLMSSGAGLWTSKARVVGNAPISQRQRRSDSDAATSSRHPIGAFSHFFALEVRPVLA